MKITSVLLCVCLNLVSFQFVFARQAANFKVKTLVHDGKKIKERQTRLVFSENSFSSVSRKNKAVIKEFNYSEIVAADYSYAEKPLFSQTEAMALTALFSVLAIPLLFLKKKEHWLSVRTADDYLVLRLGKNSYRRILAEFAARRVKVETIDEEERKSIP